MKLSVNNLCKRNLIPFDINQIITISLLVFVFLNPFPRITFFKELTFYLSFSLFFLAIIKKKSFEYKSPFAKPFLIFVLWCLIDLFFAINFINSAHDVIFHLIKYIIIFYLLYFYIRTEEKFNSLAWVIVLSGALFSTLLILYCYCIKGRDISTQLGLDMDQITSNTIGVLIIYSIIFAINLLNKQSIYKQIQLAYSIFVMTCAVLLTQTRSAIMALVCSLLILFPFHKKAVSILFIIALFLAFLFPINNRLSTSAIVAKVRSDDRIKIIWNFIEIIKDYPLTGIGFGMQTYDDKELLKKYNERNPIKYRQISIITAPHNMIIDIAVRTGVIGLILFLYILYAFLKTCLKLIRSGKTEFIRKWSLCLLASFSAIFIQGLFENTLSGPPAIVLYIIFAMSAILWNMDKHIEISNQPEFQ